MEKHLLLTILLPIFCALGVLAVVFFLLLWGSWCYQNSAPLKDQPYQ